MISVKDGLPNRDGQWVIAEMDNNEIAVLKYSVGIWMTSEFMVPDGVPVCWMPLPEFIEDKL